MRQRVASLSFEALPPDVVTSAKQCILDWVAVTLHGATEPLVTMLAEQAASEGSAKQATVLGRGQLASPRQAALVNGAASHALDYDDVNIRMCGHPTVPVLPAPL